MFIMIKRMLLINHRDVVIYCDDFREGGRMYVTVSDESWSFRFGKFCCRSLLLLKGLIALFLLILSGRVEDKNDGGVWLVCGG
jgi:hypothetical protein